MENKKDKRILISDVQLVDIIDRYEFLMFQLNTHIEPTINKMIQLQKEVQNLDENSQLNAIESKNNLS